jgi:hypothetical protein
MKFGMVRFLALILILMNGFYQTGIAQEDQAENDPDQLEIVPGQDESANEQNDVKPEKRLKPHLEAGTSFTYSPNNFYGPSFYIAPSLTYLVTPRFALTAGVAIERSNYYVLPSSELYSDGMLPMTRAFLYAKGSYLLTSRLTLSGTVYKTINDVPKTEGVSYPYGYNYQGMMMGLDFKINESISIGFHVGTNNGYYNPNSLIPPAGYVYVPGF